MRKQTKEAILDYFDDECKVVDPASGRIYLFGDNPVINEVKFWNFINSLPETEPDLQTIDYQQGYEDGRDTVRFDIDEKQIAKRLWFDYLAYMGEKDLTFLDWLDNKEGQ